MASLVAKGCAQVTGVLKVDAVTGPYDVIVLAEARSVDEMGKLVVARVQAVEGITRTLTCPVVRI
jgi:DNA-binding Lrp family transcriptional regulator